MVNKKGAIELSMTTVVVIVLAMSMLILGLVLIRTIFTGATQNVVSINENVKAQIDKLFTEENQVTALYLSTGIAEIKQGEAYGIGFAVTNTYSGNNPSNVTYGVAPQGTSDCGTSAILSSWIKGGNEGTGSIRPGERYYARVLIQPPANAPVNCIGTFSINNVGRSTDLSFPPIQFFIKVKAK